MVESWLGRTLKIRGFLQVLKLACEDIFHGYFAVRLDSPRTVGDEPALLLKGFCMAAMFLRTKSAVLPISLRVLSHTCDGNNVVPLFYMNRHLLFTNANLLRRISHVFY